MMNNNSYKQTLQQNPPNLQYYPNQQQQNTAQYGSYTPSNPQYQQQSPNNYQQQLQQNQYYAQQQQQLQQQQLKQQQQHQQQQYQQYPPSKNPQQIQLQTDLVKDFGKYNIFLKHILGAGQYGTVYLCQDKQTGHLYACKMVQIGDEDVMKELRVAQQIQGDFICELVYAGMSSNYLYLVTEYCPDGTLKKFMQTEQPNINRIMTVFFQIVKGYYESMYKVNCIHRDLKLDNILMKDGKPKICDFGFGKFLDNVKLSIEQSSKCTPVFGAPQIVNELNKSYSYKADIYSLGVILYMMTNNLSHPNCVKDQYGLTQYLEQSKQKGIRDTLKFQNQIDPNIKELIYAMMEYYEEKRISIEELLKRTEEVLFHIRNQSSQSYQQNGFTFANNKSSR